MRLFLQLLYSISLQIVYMGWCEAREQDPLQDCVYSPIFLALRGSCLYKFLAPPVSVFVQHSYFSILSQQNDANLTIKSSMLPIYFENKPQEKIENSPNVFEHILLNIYVIIQCYFITLEKSRSLFYLGIYDKQDMFMWYKSVYIKSIVFLMFYMLVGGLCIRHVWVSIAPNILLLKHVPYTIVILNKYLLNINIQCQATHIQAE